MNSLIFVLFGIQNLRQVTFSWFFLSLFSMKLEIGKRTSTYIVLALWEQVIYFISSKSSQPLHEIASVFSMTEIENQSQWLRDLHLPRVTAPKMAKLGFKLKSSKLIGSLCHKAS